VPFDRESDAAILWAHMRDGVVPPSTIRSDLTPGIDHAIAGAMCKDPAERFQTCAELIDACAAALGEHDAQPVDSGSISSATRTVSVPQSPGHGAVRLDRLDVPADSGQEGQGRRGGGGSQPPADPDGSPPTTGGASAGDPARRRRWLGAAAAVGLVAVAFVAGALVFSKSSSPPQRTPAVTPPPKSKTFPAKLGAVPTNHVTGYGSATVVLVGDVATVSVDANGLLNGAPHLMHIHAGGLGQCPNASAARLHNGHLTISTTNGEEFYGPPVASLTTSGDTSPASVLAFSRYPSTGDIRYRRTFTLPAQVAAYIREKDAVVVVHGINYDGSGIYDGVLGTSELSSKVPEEATAPALCGALRPAASVANVTSSVKVKSNPLATAHLAAAQAPKEVVYTASLEVEAADAPNWFCH
jgi:hypothetical protein